MEFWDDDFSLRARRAGYKQLLCRDTYCYHFGSVTGKDAQLKENTLEKGRNLFLRKNHADAWGSGFCYDYQDIEVIKSTVLSGLDTRSQNSEDSCNKQTAVLATRFSRSRMCSALLKKRQWCIPSVRNAFMRKIQGLFQITITFLKIYQRGLILLMTIIFTSFISPNPSNIIQNLTSFWRCFATS